MTPKPVLSLLICGCFAVLGASSPSIGTVRSNGDFKVDGAALRGNSTLFEGNLVEAGQGRTFLDVAGAEVTLMPNARARVYHDRTVLEKGSGLVTGGREHIMEAVTLRISPGTRSLLQVDITAPGRLAVAARTGGGEVRNASGILVASLTPGMALAFEPQSATPAVKISGTLVNNGGKYFVTDTTTKITVEVRGRDLAQYVGKRVDVSGTTTTATPAAGASQVVQIASIKVAAAAAGAGASGAGAGAGAAAAGAGAAGGLSTAAIAAIVGGVAVTGTVAGLAATGTFSGSSSASPQ